MDSITAARSIEHFKEDEYASLEGSQLISIESEGKEEEDFFVFVTENFASFLKLIRYLKPRDQDLLIAYYGCQKTQTQLGPVFGFTQTIASFQVRMAVRALCAFILFGGTPTADQLRPVLEKAGWEEVRLFASMERKIDDASDKTISCSLSNIVVDYQQTRNFAKVADKHGVHRPELRRTLKRCSDALGASKDRAEQAVGAYIFSLIDKANPVGSGPTVRERRKQGTYTAVDPNEVALFRVCITKSDDKMLDKVFASQGNL